MGFFDLPDAFFDFKSDEGGSALRPNRTWDFGPDDLDAGVTYIQPPAGVVQPPPLLKMDPPFCGVEDFKYLETAGAVRFRFLP